MTNAQWLNVWRCAFKRGDQECRHAAAAMIMATEPSQPVCIDAEGDFRAYIACLA